MIVAMATIESGSSNDAIAATAEHAEHCLVRSAASGDLRAFEQLYHHHVGHMFAVILRLLGGDRARAEDLTQEAFVKVWQKLSEFRFESAFSTWLHRLAVNTALMALRADRSRLRIDSDSEEETLQLVDVRPALADVRMDIETLIPLLPPRAREVLLLHDVEGWQHEEISIQLGMAVGTSKAQLHRARSLLKKWMGAT